MSFIDDTSLIPFHSKHVNFTTILFTLLLLIGTIRAEFAVSEFPSDHIDGPHRRNADLPLCNKLQVKACFSYDSPRGPSSAVWLVTAAADVTIHEWFVSGIPNMPSTGWSGAPGLSFFPSNGTIRWVEGPSIPAICSGTRQHSFQVPGLQLNPVTQNAVAAMVITYQVGTGESKICRYPVRYPVISQPTEPRNCVVDKAISPLFNCDNACLNLPVAQVTTAVLSSPYPSTLTIPAYGGSDCPTATTTCTCQQSTSTTVNVAPPTSIPPIAAESVTTSSTTPIVSVVSTSSSTPVVTTSDSNVQPTTIPASDSGNNGNWPDKYDGSKYGGDGPCSGGASFTGGVDATRCIGSWLQDRFRIFNAIFYGSLNMPSGQVEGRLAVMGDVSFNSFSIGDQLPNANGACRTGTEDDAVLAVGGHLSCKISGRVYGGVVVNRDKGTADISPAVLSYLNPNCYARTADAQALTSAFENHRQAMRTMASHLLTLTPTLNIKWDDMLWAWRVYRLKDSVTGFFDVLTFPQGVTTVNIGNWNEVVDSMLGGRSLIINLPGVTISGNDYELLKPIADRVIWNWGPDQKAVTITYVHLYGTVLAPSADITGTGTVSGHVIANSNAALSIQLAPFRGCVSAPGSGAAGGSSSG